jgi:imidazolonepropionase-like amidohydrolase
MKFPGVPQGLKLACGENPKRDFGLPQGVAPQTRMAALAVQRQAFMDARQYQHQWQRYELESAAYRNKGGNEGLPPAEPKRDLAMESLVAAMQGELPVHVHCYRVDDIASILDLAREFGFKISAIHHGTDAYKIADLLAEQGVCVATWADWWGFKMEAYDGIQENLALLDYPRNGCAIVHSDASDGIQHLNHEVAKAMVRGQRAGFEITPERAMRWITGNAAKALAIDRLTGTLEPGKAADIVIWNRDPLSVYALADQVFIDGALLFDREHRRSQPRSDFMLGQPGAMGTP